MEIQLSSTFCAPEEKKMGKKEERSLKPPMCSCNFTVTQCLTTGGGFYFIDVLLLQFLPVCFFKASHQLKALTHIQFI